jgi:hypothetical protein
MTVDFADVPLGRAVDLVAERAGLNVVWEQDIEGARSRPKTLKLSDATAWEILDKLTTPAGLAWSLEADAVCLSSAH